jgi:hypothetical protein
MSSDLVKFIRSLKGHSDHHNQFSQHDHNGNYHDSYSRYDRHDRHFFSGLALNAMRKISGKLFQNKRLALVAIIAFLAIAAVFLVFAVWLVFTLVKLCWPLIGDIEKNGLKGAVDTISKLVTRIWEGSGK